VVHLHGSASLPRYDGFPTNWYTTGNSDQYFYGNESFSGTGATLWYHDHAIGVTANNVYAGLAGFYLLRNPAFEASLNLPKAPYEIPLVFQDRDISTNCATPSIALGPFPWHNLNVVNGKVNPYLEVEPRKYRFRLLNGAGFRTYGFTMVVTDTNGYSLTSTPAKPLIPPAFNVIGSENGFLQQTAVVPPTGVTNSAGFTNYNLGRGPLLTMMPGERMDVIIDFSASAGQTITMRNIVNIADPTNLNLVIIPLSITNIIAPTNILNPPSIVVTTTNIVQITQPSITNLMQFRVSLPLSSPDTSSIPSTIIRASNWVSTATMVSNATVERNIALDFFNETPFPGAPFVLGQANPIALLDMKRFADPTAEFPHPGDTEIWNLVNLTMEAHPIHVHLLDFRVVDRARFSAWPTTYNGVDMTASAYRIYFPPLSVTNYINGRISGSLSNLTAYVDAANPPFDFESGPKDVVRLAPFSVTRIVMTWPTDPLFYTTRSGTSPLEVDTDGRYIYHCHILDHEDSDMMRPLQLRPKRLATRQLELRLAADSGHGGHVPGTAQFTLGVETKRGEYYEIEATDDLGRPAWSAVANLGRVRGTGSFVDVTLPTATSSTKFYRLKTVGNP
jgi:spore coat protein A